MERVAADNGIPLEQATFEDWRPSGRSFDLVVFAQSFHWVQPQAALDKIASILRPGGHLALLSNRITPVFKTRQELDEAYVGHLDASARLAIDAAHDDELMTMIQTRGYTVERRHVTERLHYTTDAWVIWCSPTPTCSRWPLRRVPTSVPALNTGSARRESTPKNDAPAVICTPA
jgi:SAM-dependent methyltransferase